jgi:acyl-coenzyme A synthetase/AMP-(fatty) acid ligase
VPISNNGKNIEIPMKRVHPPTKQSRQSRYRRRPEILDWSAHRNVMKGYWRKPEETAKAIPDGWFRTGDLGRAGKDAYFEIVKREIVPPADLGMR